MRTEAARATISAVVGCVRETVTNATKHSGADRVEVDASVAGETLTVYVRDHGRGFSVTRGSVGLGITESIVGRARDNDFRAGIASRPGLGTTVHLSIPLAARHNAPPAAQTDPQDRRATTTTTTTTSPAQKTPSTTGDALHRHASELWAFGATVVSMILTLIDGEDKYAALLPMIGLMLFSSVAYRWMPAARDHPAFVIALSVTTGLVFYLSAAATGFGSVDPIHWQALAPTAPFILLLTLRSDWHFRVTAAFPWLVAIAVAGAGQATSPTAARIVVVAGAVGLGFSALWSVFQTTLYRLGEHAAESAWAEHEALLRAELVDATQQSNRRWAAAGLESAIGLLREIAEGRRDLRSDCTRGDCEREERYLRQITQLSPQLVSLSRALPETLSHARELGVNYFLQIGDADAPDEASAQGMTSEIKSMMSGLGPGHDLRVSIYPVTDGVRLTLAASAGRALSPSARQAGPSRASQSRSGSVHLVEKTYPLDVQLTHAT